MISTNKLMRLTTTSRLKMTKKLLKYSNLSILMSQSFTQNLVRFSKKSYNNQHSYKLSLVL